MVPAVLAVASLLALCAGSRMEPGGRTELISLAAVSALVILAAALFSLVGLAEHRIAYIMIPLVVVTAAALYAATARRNSLPLQAFGGRPRNLQCHRDRSLPRGVVVTPRIWITARRRILEAPPRTPPRRRGATTIGLPRPPPRH